MASTRTMLLAVLAALTIGATSVNGTPVWRHVFQYKLAAPVADTAAMATAIWKGLVDAAPQDGKPLNQHYGVDLGLTNLYRPVKGVKGASQGDFLGRLDFPSKDALESFWKAAYMNKTYDAFKQANVTSATRMQYIGNSGDELPVGSVVYRHTFEYKFSSSSSSSGTKMLAHATRLWYASMTESPVKPVAGAFGQDLQMGQTLYPSFANTNFDFGGFLDFNSVDDLKGFWNYMGNLPDWREFTVKLKNATRIQTKVTI